MIPGIPGRIPNPMEPYMAASPTLSRRGFLAAGPAAVALAGLAPRARAQQPVSSGDPWLGLKVGIASYTYSRLPLDACIAGVVRVGVNYVSIKDNHLPLKSTPEERKAVAKRFRDAGVMPLSCGVVTMNDNEADIRNVFEYARDAGIPTIVCNPKAGSLPTLDKMVKEFGIRLAIHNHGPEDKTWPSPMDAWARSSRSTSGSESASTSATLLGPASTRRRRSATAPRGSTTCTSRTSPARRVSRAPSKSAAACSIFARCFGRFWISATPTTSGSNMRRT